MSDKITLDTISAESYRLADKSDKAHMRQMVDNALKEAFSVPASEIDPVAVKALFDLKGSLVASKPVPTEKDYVGLIARRAAVYALASEMMLNGTVRPDGVSDETDLSGIKAQFDTIMSECDESLTTDATDIAGRKVTKSANVYDVAEIITNAFEDVESGTFLTIRQICAKSDYPHDGAVVARLFPKSGTCTVDGIVPVARTATNVNGARKA